MLIVCPTCGTTYNVGAATLGDTGRQVRCVRCSAVWVAGKPPPLASATPKPKPGTIFDPEMALAAARHHAGGDDAAGATAAALDGDGLSGARAEDAALRADMTDRAAVLPPEPFDQAEARTTTAPPLAPDDADGRARPGAADSDARDDIESFAARRMRLKARRKRAIWPFGAVQSALLALIVFDGILVFWRSDIVRAMPQTASFYSAVGLPVNLRGLAFENVRTSRETHEGVTVLVVEGGIVNATSKALDVPRLRFSVRNGAGHEVYSWTAMPTLTVLSAREAVAFRSRLASPPADASDVVVRFFGRRDAAPAGR
jgi:predicted Zn finger-like uncharacterized protein